MWLCHTQEGDMSRGWVFIFIISAGLFSAGGVLSGASLRGKSAEVEARLTVGRDIRIVEAIVRANPAAAIRDFGGDFPSFLVAESDRSGIDFRLVMALIEKESGWNPRAVGAAGEIGLMQMLPATAALVVKRIKCEAGAVDDLCQFRPPQRAPRGGGYADLGSLGEPRLALRLGLTYLAQKIEEFGHGKVALQAYNRAPSRAREFRLYDRYAEGVMDRYVVLAHAVPHAVRR